MTLRLLRTLIIVLVLAFADAAMVAPRAAASEAIEAQADGDILMMLRMPAPHFRPGSGYGGSYGDAMSGAARKRIARQIASRYGLTVVDGWPMPELGVDCYVLLAPPGANVADLIEQISKERSVAWSQPMYSYIIGHDASSRARATGTGDPLLLAQPATSQWRLPELQRVAIGRGVRIAVIDSQVDLAHPDLAGQFIASRNFVRGSIGGPEQHGTAVAGIIAAKAGNGLGIAGVAPGAKLMALRACREETVREVRRFTVCNSMSIARALQFAIGNRTDIVNLSLSGPEDRLLVQLVKLALGRGVTVVAAFDPDLPSGGYPALMDGVISVIDDSRSTIPAGVYGAPGRGVPATQPGGGWNVVNGTSFAVAQVSGLVALVAERSNRKARRVLVRAPGGRILACATLLGVPAQCDCTCKLSNASFPPAPH